MDFFLIYDFIFLYTGYLRYYLFVCKFYCVTKANSLIFILLFRVCNQFAERKRSSPVIYGFLLRIL